MSLHQFLSSYEVHNHHLKFTIDLMNICFSELCSNFSKLKHIAVMSNVSDFFVNQRNSTVLYTRFNELSQMKLSVEIQGHCCSPQLNVKKNCCTLLKLLVVEGTLTLQG